MFSVPVRTQVSSRAMSHIVYISYNYSDNTCKLPNLQVWFSKPYMYRYFGPVSRPAALEQGCLQDRGFDVAAHGCLCNKKLPEHFLLSGQLRIFWRRSPKNLHVIPIIPNYAHEETNKCIYTPSIRENRKHNEHFLQVRYRDKM